MHRLPGVAVDHESENWRGCPYDADAASYLIDLQDEGKIQIFLHDQRPSWIPDDDQDLVDRMVQWTKENPGSDWLAYAEKHHPHLLNRIRQGLNANENE